LSEMDFVELQHFCSKQGIIFLSTPFELRSAELLDRLQVPAFKISSGELTNLPLLKRIAAFGKSIILSTGMSNLSEIREAVDEIYAEGNRQLILLHCTSNYPTRPKDVNLRAMETMRRAFSVSIGYSDHTLGIEIAVAAVALGACVIEKHFTLDRNLPGPDHQASLEPDEFRSMVKAIRSVERALENGEKWARHSEIAVKKLSEKAWSLA
ncbi:N-acetylneuraminate synthase family protein, partial [Candidatus Gottesmanbacteria bacterium]|nr:N-acetylneuraminate synthase family protein [Candidatus Gottesmanbacteria bacterium]